jgi:hypothetical protein
MNSSDSTALELTVYGPFDLVDFGGLCRRLDRRAETVTGWIRSGLLPAPVRITGKTRFWLWGHVLHHLLDLPALPADEPTQPAASGEASAVQC